MDALGEIPLILKTNNFCHERPKIWSKEPNEANNQTNYPMVKIA